MHRRVLHAADSPVSGHSCGRGTVMSLAGASKCHSPTAINDAAGMAKAIPAARSLGERPSLIRAPDMNAVAAPRVVRAIPQKRTGARVCVRFVTFGQGVVSENLAMA